MPGVGGGGGHPMVPVSGGRRWGCDHTVAKPGLPIDGMGSDAKQPGQRPEEADTGWGRPWLALRNQTSVHPQPQRFNLAAPWQMPVPATEWPGPSPSRGHSWTHSGQSMSCRRDIFSRLLNSRLHLACATQLKKNLKTCWHRNSATKQLLGPFSSWTGRAVRGRAGRRRGKVEAKHPIMGRRLRTKAVILPPGEAVIYTSTWRVCNTSPPISIP